VEAVTAMAAFFFVLGEGGWRYGRPLAPADPLYLRATTACLAAIVLMQVVNVFLCRSERESAFSTGLSSNRLILPGIAAELLLLFLIAGTPWGNAIFGTAPPSWRVVLFVLSFAAAMLLLEEAWKWWARRAGRSPAGPPPRRAASVADRGEAHGREPACGT
jgi:sodium/potassium-transporting ATPase subunit alpha